VGSRKFQIGAYGAECAEPFLKYAATCESVMADLGKLSQLPLDVLADILGRDDICLSLEQQVLEVSPNSNCGCAVISSEWVLPFERGIVRLIDNERDRGGHGTLKLMR
jgi:hypothetical protein